jgi:hypothetical protein
MNRTDGTTSAPLIEQRCRRGPLEVSYCTDSVADARWFAAHTHSSGEVVGLEVRSVTITSVRDDQRLRELTARVRSAPALRRPSYKEVSWYDEAVVDAARVLVHSSTSEQNAHALVEEAHGWQVVSEIGPQAVRNGTRVFRELLREEMLSRGALQVHASCSYRPGACVLFVGPAGAGKTTLSLLWGAVGAAVTTDRTLVLPSDTGPAAVGSPDMHRVGYGALRSFGVQPEDMQPLRPPFPIPQENQVNPDRFGSRSKKEMTALELDSSLGLATIGAAEINAVVVPEYSGTESAAWRHEQDAVEDMLLSSELIHPDDTFTDTFLRPVDGPAIELDSDSAVAVFETMARGMPVYRLRWNSDRQDTDRALNDLAQQIRRPPTRVHIR